MSIQIRPYSPEDYPMLVTWWEGHRWPAIPQAVLPKLGAIAFHHDRGAQHEDFPLCAAFLYMDNSVGVCWMEWLVSNPRGQGMETIRGINAVIGFLEEEAKRLGYGVMITSCRQESLTRIYERSGFNITDKCVTHMLKIIGGK